MDDFLLWLYANYIRPQLDAVPLGDYAPQFDLIRNDLPPSDREELGRCREFTAVHAFVLGLRTGAGMARHLPAGSPAARSSGPGDADLTPR